MKTTHLLPLLTTSICLACAVGALLAATQDEQAPQVRTISHQGEELEVTEYPNGTTAVSLEGLPMHFSVSQVSSDGSVQMKCVKAKLEDLQSLPRPAQTQPGITE